MGYSRKARICRAIERVGRGRDGDYPQALRRRVASSIMARVKEYPRQYAMVQAVATQQLSAIQANRRGGKTTGIGSMLEARLVAWNDYTVRILCADRAGPNDTWLNSSPQESFIKRLQRLGLFDDSWVKRSAGQIAAIRFPWGSSLFVHPFNQPVAADRRHGFQAHFYWADEAQAIPYLENVLGTLVLPTIAENKAQVCVSGTPGTEISSYFYRLSHDPDWHAPRVYGYDNVVFGDTDAERWATIVNTILRPARATYHLSNDDLECIAVLTRDERVAAATNELTGDLQKWFDSLNPHLRRQYFGTWVVASGGYVFQWAREGTTDLDEHYWLRDAKSPWTLDVPVAGATITERLKQLPVKTMGTMVIPYQWEAALGVDLGWNPSSTAIVVMVWNRQLPHAFILWAESQLEQPDDETRDRIVEIVRELKFGGVIVHGVKADVAGTRKGTGASWDNTLRIEFGHEINTWVSEPEKHDKDMQIRALNFQIRRGMWKFILGDDLDISGRYLKFKPQNPDTAVKPKFWKGRTVTLPDGRVIAPGDHALDGFRYGAQLVPLLEAANTPVPLTTDEFLFHENARLEQRDGFTTQKAIR